MRLRKKDCKPSCEVCPPKDEEKVSRRHFTALFSYFTLDGEHFSVDFRGSSAEEVKQKFNDYVDSHMGDFE